MYVKIASKSPNFYFTSKPPKIEDFEDDYDTRHFADDTACAIVRAKIRDHIYSRIIPNYGLDNDSTYFGAETLDDVFIPNLRKIGHDVYRGASLAKKIKYLDLLKKSGVDTVIDLEGFSNLKEACKEKNINYYNYKVGNDYWTNPIFEDENFLINNKRKQLYNKSLTYVEFEDELNRYKTQIQTERKEFMEKFIDFINVMKQGHLYIGCEFGEYRTPNILALNTYFNPNRTYADTYPTNQFFLQAIKNMYKNLTANDKLRLGFTEEYDKNLREKLGIKNDGK